MKNKYFNENSFQYALDCVEKNPFEAKIRFEEYLQKYPSDYYARAYYILLLERICMFDLAQSEYNYIKRKAACDMSFNQNGKNTIGFKSVMALAKIRLLAHYGQYQELLDFYNNNPDLFDQRGDLTYLSYYCKFHLGKINGNKYDSSSYRYLQVVNYSEDRFLDHIKKHQADYNIDLEKPNQALFVPNFPIMQILEEIKKHIPGDNKLFPGLFDDTYYFKYDNCGRVNNKMTNYFVVVCFHDTCNFITMCPANNCEYFPIIDINHLKEEDTTKVKRLSQIEKFNKRFNRN